MLTLQKCKDVKFGRSHSLGETALKTQVNIAQ